MRGLTIEEGRSRWSYEEALHTTMCASIHRKKGEPKKVVWLCSVFVDVDIAPARSLGRGKFGPVLVAGIDERRDQFDFLFAMPRAVYISKDVAAAILIQVSVQKQVPVVGEVKSRNLTVGMLPFSTRQMPTLVTY